MKAFRSALALTLCAVLLSTGLVFAAEVDSAEGESRQNTIEISFVLGESTLLINGDPVEVKAPNAVEGTTLVPLRVITEAFGAKVEWDGGIGITLAYRDTEIALELGSKTAIVNGAAVELLRAPAVENNDGITMVPLRFVSESFGADVTYDGDTGRITVTKYLTDSESITDFSAILNRSQKTKVGDSYFGWSMSLQKNMRLAYRSFDGTTHDFYDEAADVDLWMEIYVDWDEGILDIYQQEKDWVKSYTLIRQERKTGADGNEYVETEAKSATNYFYRRVTVVDGNTYDLELYLPISISAADRAPYLQLVDSFALGFRKDDAVEDLSDLDEDGLRTYQSADMDVSIKVPGDFNQRGAQGKINEIVFAKSDGGRAINSISVNVFSIRQGEELDAWISTDMNFNRSLLNPKLATFSEIKSMTLADQPARYYTTTEKDTITYDVFIYDKDYGYNVAVRMDKADEKLILKILESFRYTPLDPEAEGTLARAAYDEFEILKKHELMDGKVSFSLPMSFSGYAGEDDALIMSSEGIGAMLMVVSMPKDALGPRAILSEYRSSLEGNVKGYKTVRSEQSYRTVNEINGYIMQGLTEEDGQAVILHAFAFTAGEKSFLILVTYPEDFDGELLGDIWQGVLDSLQKTVI